MLRDLVSTILTDTSSFKGEINDEVSINFLDIFYTHLLNSCIRTNSRLYELIQLEVEHLDMVTYIFVCVDIIVNLLAIVFSFFYSRHSDRIISIILIFIKRMNPKHVVTNKEKMALLKNKKSQIEEQNISFSQMIVHKSLDCVVCTSIMGNVEAIKAEMTKKFGYSPKQPLDKT